MSKLLSFAAWFMSIDWGKVASFFFVDKEGKFQWVGVSASVGVTAFIVNIFWEHHKLNADIKSKNRIQWMNTVREYIAEYSISVQAMDLSLRKMLLLKSRHTLHSNNKITDEDDVVVTEDFKRIKNARNDDINSKSREVSKNLALLKLYITDSESNVDLNKAITDIANFIQSAREDIAEYKGGGTKIEDLTPSKYADTLRKEVDKKISTLTKVARGYMKTEWERSKKGQ